MLSGSPFAGDGTGILSPQQVGEISRLLGLYRPGPEGSSNITSAGTTPPMSDLLTYLKDLKPEYVALFSVSVYLFIVMFCYIFSYKRWLPMSNIILIFISVHYSPYTPYRSRAQDVSDHRVSQEAPTRDVTSLAKPAKRNLSSTYNAAARKPVMSLWSQKIVKRKIFKIKCDWQLKLRIHWIISFTYDIFRFRMKPQQKEVQRQVSKVREFRQQKWFPANHFKPNWNTLHPEETLSTVKTVQHYPQLKNLIKDPLPIKLGKEIFGSDKVIHGKFRSNSVGVFRVTVFYTEFKVKGKVEKTQSILKCYSRANFVALT